MATTTVDASGRTPTRRQSAPRLIWLDVARGIALVAMAIYHFGWDLEFFGYMAPGTTGDGAWKIFARSIAGSFLFLAGFSLVLGHGSGFRPAPFLRRLAMVAAAALAITAATYVATPDRFIFFGILHSIATASVIGLIFLRLPWLVTLIAGCLVVAVPHYFRSAVFDTPALWWLGLAPQPPLSNDFVPIFPWLAPFLFGMAAARIAGVRGWTGFLAGPPRPSSISRLLAFGGRHSLPVYLLHQPVLIGCVYLASLVYPAPASDPVQSYRSSCAQSCEMSQTAPFCARFCDCTLGALLDANLFNELNAGRVTAADENVSGIASLCSIEALEAR